MAFLSRGLVVGVAVATVVTLLPSMPAVAQRTSGEQVLRAAFLYNFTRYVEWPESAFAAAPRFQVCVMASEALRREVEAILHNEQVRGRLFEVGVPPPGADLKACHLVYFGAQESARAASRLAALRHAPVLTVGEGERFLEQGGVIGFLLVADHVRFDINKRAADEAGLIVSAKLLRVARRVHGARAP